MSTDPPSPWTEPDAAPGAEGNTPGMPAPAAPRAAKKDRAAEAGAKRKGEGSLGSNRGIETLYRTNYRMQVELTGLADNKANIMISINGVVMSIAIAFAAPRIETLTWLLTPTVLLLVGCLASLTFSVLAARPRLSRGPLHLDQVKSNEGNLLFFGHFVNLSRDDFVKGLHELMRDRRLLYDNMARDLYGLGRVLASKYRHLRAAYTIFLGTLVVSVGVFITSFVRLARGGAG